jgi:hypothetical protein
MQLGEIAKANPRSAIARYPTFDLAACFVRSLL